MHHALQSAPERDTPGARGDRTRTSVLADMTPTKLEERSIDLKCMPGRAARCSNATASRACPPLTTQSRPMHHGGKGDTRIEMYYVQEHAGGCLQILVVAVGGRQPIDGQTATVVPA